MTHSDWSNLVTHTERTSIEGAIHSTKISGNFGPKLNGSVRSNRKSFEKTGPPFEVVLFSRSDRSEFWLNGSRPQCQQQVYWSYPILPFGIVACTVFPTTFLEIAVYGLQKLNGAIGLHYDKESIDRSKPGNVLPFCHSLKSELWMKLLPTCRGIIAVINSPVTWEKFDLPGLQILSCDLTAPKLSRDDEWQLSIHTFCWGRKYTQVPFSVKRSQSCIFDEPNYVFIYTQGKKHFF